MPAFNIIHCPQHQIDKEKWDNCIGKSSNGLIYSLSYYLDNTAVTWDALILNDYDAVMPLPVRKKWRYHYIFEPAMTPILGVFGNGITSALVDAFLQTIPDKYKLWDYSLNHFNPIIPGKYPTYSRSNFVLPLNQDYNIIKNNFHDNITRNNKKAWKMGCTVTKQLPFNQLVNICKKTFPAFTNVEADLFEKLTAIFVHPGHQSAVYGVENADGELLSAAAFLFYKQRVFYWLVGNEPDSRKYGASSLLLDAFIRDHQQQPLLLDFEGSDSRGVADFYKKFGASPEPFTTIYYNKLPVPFRWFKRPPAHYQPSNGHTV
jgi:hypothetical protein